MKTSLSLIINGQVHTPTKDKMIVGSAQNCDLILDHPSVSHYHAMLLISPDGAFQVVDLESQNGCFINGIKIGTKTDFIDGDQVSFGKLHCQVITDTSDATISHTDEKTELLEELQASKVYVPQRTQDSDILIDDEFCDIVFSDENIVSYQSNPMSDISSIERDYIETEELEKSFPILEKNEQQCIQVTTVLNGAILEQFYFPLQAGTIYASNSGDKNHIVIDTLQDGVELPLYKIEHDNLFLADIAGFDVNQGSMNLASQDTLILTQGAYQIFIEVSDAPDHILHISSLRRETGFYKDTLKKFSAVILPMLLLLLVDFSIEKQKPLKELSIIYKKPTNANIDGKKMASTNPNDTKKNTGHKSQKQPDKKIAHSKAGEKAQPKKAPSKKVAKSQSKRTKKSKAKTKTYNFKLATNVNSMFSNSKTVAVSNSNTPSTVQTTSNVSGSLNTKVNGTSSSQVGRMGSDAAGRALASFGSKGLSSKAGRDTAYIQTETVVLGSMDPELLRKILQQYLPQFRHCYQQELAYNADDIKGMVDLNFEITPSGKVSKAKVRAKDSRFSRKGLDCMQGVLAIIDFPKPKGGGRVAVRQPLSFFSEQEKG